MKENRECSETNFLPRALDWKKLVAPYQNPSRTKAAWQIINTLGPYALLWYLMYRTLAGKVSVNQNVAFRTHHDISI